jgi:hypothetical protein
MSNHQLRKLMPTYATSRYIDGYYQNSIIIMGRGRPKPKRISAKAQMRIKFFETRKSLDAVHRPFGGNKDTAAHLEPFQHNPMAPRPPPYDAGAPYYDDVNNYVPPPPPPPPEAGGFPPPPPPEAGGFPPPPFPPPPPPEAGGFPPPFYGCYFPYYGNDYHHPEYFNTNNNNNTADNNSIDVDDIPATVTKEEEDSSMTTSYDNRRIIANSVPSTTLEIALAAELDRQMKYNKELSEELEKLRRIVYSRMKETQDYETEM